MKSSSNLILLFAIITLSSCTVTEDFYQVYKATPDSSIIRSVNSLTYSDTNCELHYNLWSEDGNIGFDFYNKTDSDIYIHLDQCYYVLNGFAYDYYQDRVFTKSRSNTLTTSESTAASRSVTGVNAFDLVQTNKVAAAVSSSNASSSGYAVSYNEPRVICVPPKTSKRIDEFGIYNDIIRDCNLARWPGEKSKTTLQFNRANSPVVFGNRITYTIGTDTEEKHISNEFYVSEITNYSIKGLFSYGTKEFCEERSTTRRYRFRFTAPDMFYNSYPYVVGGFSR